MKNTDKNFKLLRAFGDVSDKYVLEADPSRPKEKKVISKKLIAFAACFAILFSSLSLWLFIPYNTDPPSVDRYKSSHYFPIIEKINTLNLNKPRYDNNFDMLISNFAQTKEESSDSIGGDPTATGTADGGLSQSYVETTDNQAEGVIEADLIKRSTTHIYYMKSNTLCIFSINGEDSELISSYTLSFSDGSFSDYTPTEIYLSPDCRTVTVLGNRYPQDYVFVINLDVSDPANIKEVGRISIGGNILSSRSSGDELLLLTLFTPKKNELDFDDPETFIPSYDKGEGKELLPLEKIIFPEDLSSTVYTVVTKLDQTSLGFIDTTAFLSYSSNVYASRDSVYVTRTFYDEEKDSKGIAVSHTEISRLVYSGDRFDYRGSVTLDGYLKDQYSLDEYEGILRAVTTVRSDRGSANASLFCIDINNMKTVASVEKFAPEGETVKSVRFDGTSAYVCTAVERTDPVFFFDLSDLKNITFKDTGNIKGFSTSLVNFGDGTLLGIGEGDSFGTLKIEVYREGDRGVESVCSYETKGYYSNSYKSYLIDRENSIIGLAVIDDKGLAEYLLIAFNGSSLRLIEKLPLYSSDTVSVRGVYTDDFLYVLTPSDFKVQKID